MHTTLLIYLDDRTIPIHFPNALLHEAAEFFAKMDADMARGWQMSREWVDCPDTNQRCQIVADKILGAIELDNQQLATLMAAYIVCRRPQTRAIAVATNGEMQETELLNEADPLMPPG